MLGHLVDSLPSNDANRFLFLSFKDKNISQGVWDFMTNKGVIPVHLCSMDDFEVDSNHFIVLQSAIVPSRIFHTSGILRFKYI